MSHPFQTPVILGERCRAVLESELRRHSCPQQLALRIRIILGLAEGTSQARLAKHLGAHVDTIRLWRTRWLEVQDALFALEDDPKRLSEGLEKVFADQPRPGTPPTFKPEQVAEIMALACQKPEHQVRWTWKALAEAAVERNIVSSISRQSVGRFLKSGGPQAPSHPAMADTPTERS